MYPRNRVGGFLAHAGFSVISLLGALLLSGCAATQSTPHLSYLTVTPMNSSRRDGTVQGRSWLQQWFHRGRNRLRDLEVVGARRRHGR
jgi:hypothetical protein